ncbi:Hrp-dependent type III effector protein [Bradyrhizobium sp. 180]|uniref:four-carbon acid sugar kinase family protein n=1 Tax=unclassified Bradyrhizobium TaxID=2631580 RepID=UPI001FFBF27A|nr:MULTISPECIES: four-carbon acid sugar kinase family protein [unclassified Bradyrhizobium]MCK1491668.1 Hrp-dependent type III effector protein [Bradyrhizobium sp. 180]MCK1596599.1 Hrp-dependent type III effector protein [Bradyrhizobium sp. 164]MCK1619976.1 Hrp-dependent type III effector protein [Bradyrhizobium sp. 159]MCK1759802.1 Hrp-dependent type III effector protein [Bradyrhizobium sp. 137]
MTSVRLLADDLSGALDTAAEFVGLCGPFDVTWLPAPAVPNSRSLAIDSGTRERSKAKSVEIVGRLAPQLRGATIAYKKVDSLLRGAWAAELGACLHSGDWASCVVAPAFDYQGRRTVDGQQFARTLQGEWHRVGDNLLTELRQEDIEARQGGADTLSQGGVQVFDAESDIDLDRIVQMGRRMPGPVLWCGSGGLAGALARSHRAEAPGQLKLPVLGLFGSDQPATASQLAACGAATIALAEGGSAAPVRHKLADDGVALVKFALAEGLARAEAARRIAREMSALIAALEPPGTLIVAGGETLKAACVALGAHALQVTGRIVPGLPRSILQGGRWAGVDVISKSGAFGPSELWRDLLRDNHLLNMGSPT